MFVRINVAWHHLIIHRGDCRWCNHGHGLPSRHNDANSIWTQEIATIETATALGQELGWEISACEHYLP